MSSSARTPKCQPPRCNDVGQVTNPQSSRICDIRFQNRPLNPAQHFVLATNSYRAVGSGAFPGATPDRIILSGHDSSRNALIAYIGRIGTMPSAAAPNWRFVPMPGTTTLFDTSPAASAYTADLAPLTAEPLDLTPSGFRRFRLHL